MFFVGYGLGCAHLFALMPMPFGYLGLPLALGFGAAGWVMRGSDIRFEPSGLSVLGRRVGCRSLAWDAVQSTDVYDDGVSYSVGASQVKQYLLRVTTADRVELVADGRGEDERAELEVIADSISAVVQPPGEAPAAELRDAEAAVLRCPGCGALVTPADSDEVKCAFCGSAVAMPEQVRKRVRDARGLAGAREKEEKALSRLMAQPTAGRAIVLQGLTFAVGMGSAAGWGLSLLPPLASATLTLATVALFGVERATMVDRRAVRQLSRYMGAIPPLQPGAPSLCHSCGAPLPDAPGSTFVRCLFCNSANLLSSDLRGAWQRSAGQAYELEEVLQTRREQRRAALRRTIIALVVVAIVCAIAVARTWK